MYMHANNVDGTQSNLTDVHTSTDAHIKLDWKTKSIIIANRKKIFLVKHSQSKHDENSSMIILMTIWESWRNTILNYTDLH